jgi:putative hydrolase of the HAD superfamily
MVRAERAGGGIQVVSFDVDGTLVAPGFVDSFWLDGVPRVYAAKNGIPVEQAVKYVANEYDKVGEHRIEWYTIDYWLQKFDLDISYRELFAKYQDLIHIYDEVEPVLTALRDEGYELVISSNATREFIDFQTKSIKKFFSRVFSATSDFGEVKKSDGFFARVCEILGVKPGAVVHTGDHWVFDFLNPRKIGITAYYLDRNRKEKTPEEEKAEEDSEFIITDLTGLLDDSEG